MTSRPIYTYECPKHGIVKAYYPLTLCPKGRAGAYCQRPLTPLDAPKSDA